MDGNEREAVRTTIVGGRPPGSGRSNTAVPRGIEVLVKKASVDPEFRKRLLSEWSEAAKNIELRLEPAEEAMLSSIPREQLAGIIERTIVPVEQRRTFLGQVAVAMLAALGVGVAGCAKEPEESFTSRGVQPDRPAKSPPSTNVTKPQPIQSPSPAGIRPAPAVTNQPVSRGIRPDRP